MLRSSQQNFRFLTTKSSPKSMSSSPVLDRAVFSTTLPLVSIKIRKETCTKYQQTFKGHLFDRPRMKRIYDVPDEPDFRYILLKEETTSTSTSALPAPLLQFIEEQGCVLGQYELQLGYEDLSVDEVLTRLLPGGCEVPSSFEQVGHLAHMNLRDDVLQYKHIIGQVILDKNPKLRTVVNKTGNIETEFRTFPMELLAGDEEFEVAVKESGATFRFNFKDVYWNSRLGTEHNRIITSILEAETTAAKEDATAKRDETSAQSSVGSVDRKEEQKEEGEEKSALGKRSREIAQTRLKRPLPVIADMMGGVGPFSVPLGKSRACEVHCNDLNPASYACMVENARTNQCRAPFLRCYNQCGRDFITALLSTPATAPAVPAAVPRIDHVLMNLPQSATDFLDVFIGYNCKRHASDEASRADLPIIHVYAFSTSVSSPLASIADIAARSAGVLGCPVSLLGALHLASSTPPPGSSKASSSSSSRASSNFVTLMTRQQQQQQQQHDSSPLCFGHIVRNVSPKKVMVCLSFRLPRSVADKECS